MIIKLSLYTGIFLGIFGLCLGIAIGIFAKWRREMIISSIDPAAKLCRDCHWVKQKGPVRHKFTFAKCMHPSSVRDAGEVRVSGLYYPDNMAYCSTSRNSFDKTKCGPEGQFWEAKK